MRGNTYITDGLKMANIDALPEEAWTVISGGGDSGEIKKLHQSVPWFFRGIDLRAQAVSSLPFAITRNGEDWETSEDYQNKLGFLPNPGRLFYLLEAALTLQSKAYLFREYNRVKTLDLRYVLASTITPKFDKKMGLVGFERRVDGEPMKLDVDDLLYFWRLDPWVEIGPGESSPAAAALAAAGVLFNVDEFASAYFQRGMVKTTVLSVSGGASVNKVEKERFKSWWRKVAQGIGNAFATEVLDADTVNATVIGEGIGELSNTELTQEKREDIATALGIPQTILFSNAANYATARQDDLHYYTKTIEPEAKFIASVFNEQLLEPMGYKLTFRPETLDAYQEDERQRAQAFSLYVSSGLKPGMVAQMLGLELPEGVEYDDLDEDKVDRTPEQLKPFNAPAEDDELQRDEANAEAMRADLRKWRTKARRAGGPVPFESEFIPEVLKAAIETVLESSGVDAAFSFMKQASTLDAERRIAERVNAILAKYLPKLIAIIRQNGNVDLKPLSDELRAAIGPEISTIATEQGLRLAAEVGVEFDPAVVNEWALQWARDYSYELITGLTDTTRGVVSRAIEQYTATPGMTRADLEALLKPAFGEYRASMIAVTEVTRAYSQATGAYREMLDKETGIRMEKIWRTANDELVCPICGPLNGQPEKEWVEQFPIGPPAHVNCRCGTTLRVP